MPNAMLRQTPVERQAAMSRENASHLFLRGEIRSSAPVRVEIAVRKSGVACPRACWLAAIVLGSMGTAGH
jgi:hypothetical protein